jgi:hypothetical protein
VAIVRPSPTGSGSAAAAAPRLPWRRVVSCRGVTSHLAVASRGVFPTPSKPRVHSQAKLDGRVGCGPVSNPRGGLNERCFFLFVRFFPRPGTPVEQVAIPAEEGVTEQSLRLSLAGCRRPSANFTDMQQGPMLQKRRSPAVSPPFAQHLWQLCSRRDWERAGGGRRRRSGAKIEMAVDAAA